MSAKEIKFIDLVISKLTIAKKNNQNVSVMLKSGNTVSGFVVYAEKPSLLLFQKDIGFEIEVDIDRIEGTVNQKTT